MTDTWIPWAERRTPSAGGENKEGYGGSVRTLEDILFQVNHSAEGWLAYLLNFHRPGDDASWGLVGAQDGTLYQGRRFEAVPWTSGSRWNNEHGLAIEWEGVTGQPLTPEQVQTGRRLYDFAAAVCPNLGPPVFPGGFREHGELTGGVTTCPSGRIQPLYDSYSTISQEEDEEEDEMAKPMLIRVPGGAIWVFDGVWKTHVKKTAWELLQKFGVKQEDAMVLTYAEAEAIPDHPIGTNSRRIKELLTIADSVQVPTMQLSDGDFERIAREVNDDAAKRLKD